MTFEPGDRAVAIDIWRCRPFAKTSAIADVWDAPWCPVIVESKVDRSDNRLVVRRWNGVRTTDRADLLVCESPDMWFAMGHWFSKGLAEFYVNRNEVGVRAYCVAGDGHAKAGWLWRADGNAWNPNGATLRGGAILPSLEVGDRWIGDIMAELTAVESRHVGAADLFFSTDNDPTAMPEVPAREKPPQPEPEPPKPAIDYDELEF